MTKQQALWVHSRNVLCHLRFIRHTFPDTTNRSQGYDNGADYMRELVFWLKANIEYAPDYFKHNPDKV